MLNDIQEKLLLFFKNEKLLKGIRSIGVSLIIIILPLLYFGFKANFNIAALLQVDFGVLVVIITASVILATKETKDQCYDLTCEHDPYLPQLHKDIKTNSKKIRNLDRKGKHSSKWITKYNKEMQELYDEQLTNEKIELLERKILTYRINGKEHKAVSLEKQIDKLKSNPLHDKTFEPYSIKRILNIDKNSFTIKRKKGNADIKVNPKRINWTNAMIGMIIRSTGLGVAGTIPFVMGESASTVLIFYVGYIIVVSVTVISQWIITSYITTHAYKSGLEKIIEIQDLMIEDLPQSISTEATYKLVERQLEEIPFSE